MPGPDEIRRAQEESRLHRPNLAEQLIREIVPQMKAYDPVVLRRRLAESISPGTYWEPNTATNGVSPPEPEAKKRECPICGLNLMTGMFCPRCSNLIP